MQRFPKALILILVLIPILAAPSWGVMATTTHGAPKPAYDDGGADKATEFNAAQDLFDTAIWTALGLKVPTSLTVNSKALSGNITLGLASADFANQGTTTTVLHGNASGNPSFGAVNLPTDVTGVLPPANGGGLQGTTVSSSGTNTVTVTTALNRQTFVQDGTATNTYALPTGDLSANISASVQPLTYRFVKRNANTLTIDPGAGNFISGGGAGKTMTNSVAGETYAGIILQLVYSTGSVNHWVIPNQGTWVSTP